MHEINHQAKMSIRHILACSLYMYFCSLDSKAFQEINMLDAENPPVTLTLNIDTINLSFLLCPSGMYIKSTIGCTHVHGR